MKGFLSSFFAVLATCLCGHSYAGIIYGTTGSGGTISNLVTIDLDTGVTTVLGSTGIAINGLTYDTSTGTLYASERRGGGLYTLDTSSGSASLVGNFNAPAGGCSSYNVTLTSNSSGDLYGWCDPSSDDLMSIDKTTGQATVVGNSGVSTGRHGLSFDRNDDLYLVNRNTNSYSINTTTGAASFLGSYGGTSHHGDFNDIDNLYYGIQGSNIVSVYDIVGGTGFVESISLDRSIFTIAFASEVPEPAPFFILGAGLLGLGLSRRKASRSAPSLAA